MNHQSVEEIKMALKNISDKELLSIVLERDGLKKFLANKDNLKRVLGIDTEVIGRVENLLGKEGKSKAEIKNIIESFHNVSVPAVG